LWHSVQANRPDRLGASDAAYRTASQTVAEFAVHGMTCANCSRAIEQAVRAIRGIESVRIDLTTDTATIAWLEIDDHNTVAPLLSMTDRITNAIEDIGYQVTDATVVSTNQSGTSSSNTPGNSANGSNATPSTAIVAQRWLDYRERQVTKVRQRRAAAVWAGLLTLPIVVTTMILPHVAPHAAFFHWQVTLHWFHQVTVVVPAYVLLIWMCATLVQFGCGYEFYKMAWYGFWKRTTAGMDLLVVLGTTASYGYAMLGALQGDDMAPHFWETSSVLIWLVLVGQWMQAAAVRQTSEALTQLMALQSATAIVVTPFQVTEQSVADNDFGATTQRTSFNPLTDPYQEQIVPIEHVLAGDIVKVIRGASVPADGVVLHGEVLVDESMMTGESLPILKTRGAMVLGGTICVETGSDTDRTDTSQDGNNAGAAFVQVTGVGSSTALAQIVHMVQQAQTRAVPIQAFADQVSAIFVPTVCIISLSTYLVWYVL
jgi:P-type Cu+ transporter